MWGVSRPRQRPVANVGAQLSHPLKFGLQLVLLVAHVDPILLWHSACTGRCTFCFQRSQFPFNRLGAFRQELHDIPCRQVVGFGERLREARVFLDRLGQKRAQSVRQFGPARRKNCVCGAFRPVAVPSGANRFNKFSHGQPANRVIQRPGPDLEHAFLMTLHQQLVHLVGVHCPLGQKAQSRHGQWRELFHCRH